MGLIIASPDPVDLVATRIIGLKPEQVPTIVKTVARGLNTGNIDDIEVCGEKLAGVLMPDFKKPTVKVCLIIIAFCCPRLSPKIWEPYSSPPRVFIKSNAEAAGCASKAARPGP